jgi:hypothetical protein
MMTPDRLNRPRLDDMLHLPVAELLAMPAEHLALLQDDATSALEAAKRTKDWMDGIIAVRYGQRAIALRAEQCRDTGTVRFTDNAVTVVADLPKRVVWDQRHLAAVVARISAGGDDPAEYVEVSYKVAERSYTAWPDHIRQVFAAARTVRTGKASFKLSLNPAAEGV